MPKKMTDDDLRALVDREINHARSLSHTERNKRHEKAIGYYEGRMDDLPAEEGESQVVSQDVADTIGWILPGVMRVFTASERLVDYEPRSPEDEAFADQAADYANYVFQNDNDGFSTMYSWFHDALLLDNGFIMCRWDDSPVEKVSTHTGLTQEQLTLLLAEDGTELVSASDTYQQEVIDPTGQPIMIDVVDAKVSRVIEPGRVKIDVVPPEEMIVEPSATSLDDVAFLGRRRMLTASDLREMGIDQKTIDSIPTGGTVEFEPEHTERHDEDTSRTNTRSGAMREVEVFECFIKCDYDGDGKAEYRRVLMAGNGKRALLEHDEVDEHPFETITPDPVPHRLYGRSIFDDTQDIQRIKTELMRNALDNLYMVNAPQRLIDTERLENPEDIVNHTLGGVGLVNGPVDGVVQELAVPFTAQQSFPMLEYLDRVNSRRTGISEQSMGLDPETLQNQTATAVAAQQSSGYAKQELIARIFAETGVKKLFAKLLRIIIRHQDRPRTIRLRNKWVEIDPRHWNADMDVSVNVGLGSGSRERDMQMLGVILNEQKQLMQALGPMNPVAGVDKVVRTLQKLAESAGLKQSEMFFGDVEPQELQAFMQQQAQGQQQQIAAQAQAEQAKTQMEMQLKAQAQQADIQLQREKAAVDMQLQREKAEAQLQLKREEARLNAELKRQEMEYEAALAAQKNAAGGNDVNIQGPV